MIAKDVSFGCGGASVDLGTFQDNQEFIIVRELTVQCLLGGGGDFMEKHGVVIKLQNQAYSAGSGFS